MDTDTVWVHDPFPALHDICRATNASLVVQQDNPFVTLTLTLTLTLILTLTLSLSLALSLALALALALTRTTRSSTPGSSMRGRAARRS